jgi:SAM-dependent methyltransferase
MTQNVYDDEEFFAEYGRLPRSLGGLSGAPEWPALRALIPDLHGCRVLDLGCGYGWFCRCARENGAAQVVGVDVSERMLARARDTTSDAAITYLKADLETLDLSAQSFDLVYSSLTFHYIKNLDGLLSKVRESLVSGGNLVFSMEHPIFTAPSDPAWSLNGAGRKVWPLDRYLAEGARSVNWLTKDVVKQHRTLATYINLLIRLGFAISHVEEWGPTAEQIASHPAWADERERPPFMLIAANRQTPR